jgi:two-component system chemotaxis response regulator CheY
VKFLIVDDDGVCRALLQAILSPYGRCFLAYDGQEAVDAFRLALEDNEPYHLVCLDIMMPNMNGHDALKAIRALEAKHGIVGSDGAKVIMTTALRDSKHCVQSFREGCEGYVTKPVHEGELLQRMRDLGLLAA